MTDRGADGAHAPQNSYTRVGEQRSPEHATRSFRAHPPSLRFPPGTPSDALFPSPDQAMHAMLRALTVLPTMQGMIEYGATSGFGAGVITSLKRALNRGMAAGSENALLVVGVLVGVLVLWNLASRAR